MTTRPTLDRPPHYILTKIIRISSWPLLVVVLCFLATGYAMSGQYGFGAAMDAKRALTVHKLLHGVLLVLLVVHALPAMYVAFRRWGWIGKPEKI